MVELTIEPANGATAKAYIINGTVDRVEVDNPGSGFTALPTMSIKDCNKGTVLEATIGRLSELCV